MEKVLEGIKVVDMCVAAAGPSCSRMLVDFGAEDIQVEPLEGQSTRYTSPHTYHFKTSGKKSIPCNLKTPEGKELVYKLIERADVFVSNFRKGALERLGFGYEELSKRNPGLVYGHLDGFGEKGPMKDSPGFDATAWWAKSGLLTDIAQPDSIVQVPYATGDFSGGHSLALGICAALYKKAMTGKGSYVCASLMGSGIFLNYDAIIETQYGYQLPNSRKRAPRAMLNTYRCKDKWIAINATHHWEKTWPCVCKTIGRMDIVDKYTCNEDTMWDNSPEVIAILDEGFSKITAQEAFDGLMECGTIAVEIASHSIDVSKDPQAIANGFVVPWTSPEGVEIMHPTTPVRIGDLEPPKVGYGPRLGEHTEEVMKMIGYTDEEIQDYVDRKIVIREEK